MDRVNPPTFEVYFACEMSGLREKGGLGGLTGFRQDEGFGRFESRTNLLQRRRTAVSAAHMIEINPRSLLHIADYC